MTKPILKWAGGKTRLLPELIKRIPPHARYFEAFAGGASLFFALAPRCAVLNDINPDLVETYTMIRDESDDVMHWLEMHASAHSSDHFYEVRDNWNGRHYRGPGLAAAFIYLNRTCYNGLHRVNRKGEFNVPFGKYANPTICDRGTITAASAALQGVDLRRGDYRDAVADAASGDFVYFDPPYVPASKTSNFASYTADTFGEQQQRELVECARDLVARGVGVLISNSDTPLTREIYREFSVDAVGCPRNINSNTSKRGDVSELLVSGRRVSVQRDPEQLSLFASFA